MSSTKWFSLLTLLFVMTVSSCKPKAFIAEAKATKPLKAEKLIRSHYELNKDFKTAYIKADVRYKDTKESLNLSADIRLLKDEKILISIRFFGITMAKGLITPTEVKYYEKNGGKYFEGDYTTLSKWLGTDLDFKKVQNMLIGEAFDNLEQGKYSSSVENGLYKLEDKTSKNNLKTFLFEASAFLIKQQQIQQLAENRALTVDYPSHKQYDKITFPTALQIEALNQEKKTQIDIIYSSVKFNDELSFPYSVPSGYDRTFID
jgi:hypothetical protein